MFVLERAEQLEELLRSWAWRLKHRRLTRIPIPRTPEPTDLLLRLLRYSGPSIQELWGLESAPDQISLWIEEPHPPSKTMLFPNPGPALDRFGLPPYWDWALPLQSAGGPLFPLCLFQQAETTSGLVKAPPPAVHLAYARDTAGLWKHGAPWLTRFEAAQTLSIRSDHPAQKIFTRKLLLTLFDWQTTLFIDLEESPLTLLGHRPAEPPLPSSLLDSVAKEQVGILCHRLLEKGENRFVVILCDTVRSPFEAELITLFLNHLMEVRPLFICLEPTHLLPFTWSLREEIDQITPHSSHPGQPSDQAGAMMPSPLIELKLKLLQTDEPAVSAMLSSPAKRTRLHQDPSALIKVLHQTEQSWERHPGLVLIVVELCLTLMHLRLAEIWLNKQPHSGSNRIKAADLESRLSRAKAFSPEGLYQLVLKDKAVQADERPSHLLALGYPALSILAETDLLMSMDSAEETGAQPALMNKQLFRSRCLGSPDLQIWISLVWAHWSLVRGSPAKAALLLRDCLPLCQESSLSVQPSLNLCNTLLGHWGCTEPWPRSLPGGFLPPHRDSWTYLHLLLQHRFPEAEVRYRETIAQHTTEPETRHRTCAGLCPANMVLLHDRLNQPAQKNLSLPPSYPPWLAFIQSALSPFYPPAGTRTFEGIRPAPGLITHERSYFYYEHHHLRYHDPQTNLPENGEERDLFLDTCAYFTRRGRPLSSTMEALRNRLAQAAIRENRSSQTLLVQSAHPGQQTGDLLRTALGILQSRFHSSLCVIRLLKQNNLLHKAGTPDDGITLADHLFTEAQSPPEELLSPETIQHRLPRTTDPFIQTLGSIHLFRLPLGDETLSLQILLGFAEPNQPGMPLFDRLQRCLSPLVDILSQTRQLAGPSPLDEIIGESPVIMALKKQIQKVSRVDFTVTISGESGTGKELIARSIHHLSRRQSQPFIAFNCASLPETLLEAELMGVMKGAFTDARENRAGLIESAQGGTLFLDEIGEMPLLLQAKLLRFLSDHTIRRLGDNQLRQVDCRILCATHRDLREMVAQKTFREDLFYRIHELTVMSPPLRHRREDLPLLLDHFIRKYGFTGLSQTKKHWLALRWMHLDWPGNVRELESRVKELITYYPHHPDIEDIPHPVYQSDGCLHHSRQQFERICILNSLEKNNWNRNQSAAALGVSRIALFKLMRKHKLKDPESPAAEF